MTEVEFTRGSRRPSQRQARRVFSIKTERIVTGVLARSPSKPGEARRSPNDNRNGYLKRNVYRLVRRYLRQGHDAVIEEAVEAAGKAPSAGPTFQENPFLWGLLALTDDRFLKPQERWLFAKQMAYAHSQNVPSKYLVGFLYQTGSQAELLRLAAEEAADPINTGRK